MKHDCSALVGTLAGTLTQVFLWTSGDTGQRWVKEQAEESFAVTPLVGQAWQDTHYTGWGWLTVSAAFTEESVPLGLRGTWRAMLWGLEAQVQVCKSRTLKAVVICTLWWTEEGVAGSNSTGREGRRNCFLTAAWGKCNTFLNKTTLKQLVSLSLLLAYGIPSTLQLTSAHPPGPRQANLTNHYDLPMTIQRHK